MHSTPDNSAPARVRAGIVTASTPAAADAGRQMLAIGGNAVDAAVATALASCVADPCNTGLGGYGGHMVIAPAAADPVCVDFNVWAPAEAKRTHDGETSGPAASTIPNVVAGLAAALENFGTLDWAAISAPALAFAREGVAATSTVARAFENVKGMPFVDECFVLAPTEAGSDAAAFRFRQPALADTLENMAVHGPGWFYIGRAGEAGRKAMADAGLEAGEYWSEGLAAPIVDKASAFNLRNVRLYSSPLETSGSACMFATAAAAPPAGPERYGGPEAIAEWAARIASVWSFRFGHRMGNNITQEELGSWIERAISFMQPAAISTSGGHTCHLNAADAEGMMAAMTLTHGKQWFGARWAVPDTGVIMNYGAPMLSASAPKKIGRRLYGTSNMAPTVAVADDGTRIAAGCPGGPRIPTIVATTLARHLFGGLPLQEAICAPRFHAETMTLATIEKRRCERATEDALAARFGRVENEKPEFYYGPLTAIRRAPDGALEAGIDDRWRGYAAAPGLPAGEDGPEG